MPYVKTSLDRTPPARVISSAMLISRPRLPAPLLLLAIGIVSSAAFAASPTENFGHSVRPLLEKNCYECHGEGAHKGNVAFDQYDSDDALVHDTELWLRVL